MGGRRRGGGERENESISFVFTSFSCRYHHCHYDVHRHHKQQQPPMSVEFITCVVAGLGHQIWWAFATHHTVGGGGGAHVAQQRACCCRQHLTGSQAQRRSVHARLSSKVSCRASGMRSAGRASSSHQWSAEPLNARTRHHIGGVQKVSRAREVHSGLVHRWLRVRLVEGRVRVGQDACVNV
jgi:hypothetical protein